MDLRGFPHLVQLRTRPEIVVISEGRVVLATHQDGSVSPEPEVGLFVYGARMLSRWRLLVDGEPLEANAVSPVQGHTWLGYYLAPPKPPAGCAPSGESPQHALEIRVSRVLGDGLHEDIDIANYTGQPAEFELALEVDADFADRRETRGPRKQHGEQRVAWADGALALGYHVERDFERGGDQRHVVVDAETRVRVERAGSTPHYAGGRIGFAIALRPHERWHACLVVAARYASHRLEPRHGCHAFAGAGTANDARRGAYLHESSSIAPPRFADDVRAAIARARADLGELRLHDLDIDERSWVVAGGRPTYDGLFGRDSLTAGWQTALLSPALLRGALGVLARYQGTQVDDWRDEEPGRILHQARTGPLSLLELDPFGRNYSSISSSAFYPVALAELWHWTADRPRVEKLLPTALRAIAWRDQYGDLDGDGFYEYLARSRSPDIPKNQAWKDSGEAIVYGDGCQVEPPIAICEEQAYTFGAKQLLATVCWQLDHRDEARRLWREARELKKRFNAAFWMPDAGYFALGLDSDKHQIDAIASNAGQAIASGIVDRDLVVPTIDRLFAPDMFSGWGIRTLSADNPSYNPVSYQRGSVWPAEQATIAFGLYRYGLRDRAALLAERQFELSACFGYHRLPECYGGQPRDRVHPFPALYPRADWPQAWSASSQILMIQTLLGLHPFAGFGVLFVDPVLPPWLPELTVEHLRVGRAVVSLRFRRRGDGRSDYEITEQRGKLRVLRQASPWSMTTSMVERVEDLVASVL